MTLFPKQIDFFEVFDRISENITKAAGLLVDFVVHFDDIEKRTKEIHEAEKEGDILTHEIMRQLNQTFITPIDREDLYALASRLDDVLDLIWGAVDRMMLFKIKEMMPKAVSMSKDLLLTTEVMQKAIHKLRKKHYSHVQEYCIEINRLENRIDRDFKEALAQLFDEMTDPILLIKWKEIYEHLEDASDKCEDVANILEAIILKYA
ncbi:MAG: hypothetical protein A2521_17360 [Deltaproteobacteria bacterium RIFOXYD12_FULL_57_12]|nr:MAG: hypothetical protein A2521_17360 [Deltaproteobacteria bacterium RIFOXYD12_FULL_57_12]